MQSIGANGHSVVLKSATGDEASGKRAHVVHADEDAREATDDRGGFRLKFDDVVLSGGEWIALHA
jgi:hypothetical protein